MIRRTLVLVTALLLSTTMACTTTQKWMAGGAAIGATVGGVWAAHHGSLNAGHGALVGAVTGATAGALVGDLIDEKETQAELDRLRNENAQLQSQLEAARADLAQANARISELEAELARLRDELGRARVPLMEIDLAAETLFRPGSARLSDTGKAKLNEVAQTIQGQYRDKFIMIEGHTDAQPIQQSSWKSNWELGAARSLTVLHYLVDQGVDPALLSAATFSKYQPVATNDTPEGRQQNRRAVVVIYNAWPRSGQAQ